VLDATDGNVSAEVPTMEASVGAARDRCCGPGLVEYVAAWSIFGTARHAQTSGLSSDGNAGAVSRLPRVVD
jgi:hypothetical protein